MSGVWAVTMVKDEADVIEGVLRHMAGEGVDGILVADNGSTDGTSEILDTLELGCQLIVTDDHEPAYYQGEKMSALAGHAAAMGADWIVPFDADELWLAPDRVAQVLREQTPDITAVQASLYNHFPTAIDDELEPDPFRRIRWRLREIGALPKVAFRWAPGAEIHQGNHGVTINGANPRLAKIDATIRHFSYRSEAQFVRKARNGAAAYAATNLPLDLGAHWREYGAIIERFGEQTLIDEVYRKWFWSMTPVEQGWVQDPAAYRRWEELA